MKIIKKKKKKIFQKMKVIVKMNTIKKIMLYKIKILN